MPVEAVFAGVAFVGMFVAWAVAPSFLRKRHTSKVDSEESR